MGGSDKVLQTAASIGMSRSRTFILEAEELLEEVGLDYATAFGGAEELLHKIKGSIEAMETHDAILVCLDAGRIGVTTLTRP